MQPLGHSSHLQIAVFNSFDLFETKNPSINDFISAFKIFFDTENGPILFRLQEMIPHITCAVVWVRVLLTRSKVIAWRDASHHMTRLMC